MISAYKYITISGCHNLHGELGGGGTRIKLSNVNGTIAIRHASDGHTLSSPKELDPNRDGDDGEL